MKTFNEHTNGWFDKLAESTDKELKTILAKYSRLSPSRATFLKLKLAIFNIPKNHLRNLLYNQLDAIDNNEFKTEFRFKFGEHSQFGELLSMIKQGLTYEK